MSATTERPAGQACCQAIIQPTASPFEVVQFDYYDGTTAGLARCKTCGTTYAFDTLGTTEDGRRAFGFARVASDYFEAVAREFETPASKMTDLLGWRERVALAEARFPTGQGERDLLVVSRNIEGEVLAARRIKAAEWVELVGRR